MQDCCFRVKDHKVILNSAPHPATLNFHSSLTEAHMFKIDTPVL